MRDAARRRDARCSTSAAACSAPTRRPSCAEFAEHAVAPGRAQPDGQGRAARRPSARAGHDRLLGHHAHQRPCARADWILALGTRFAEADSSSWYPEYTFDIPPTKLMQIDIDPSELGRNYPLEIGAVADLKAALHRPAARRAQARARRRVATEAARRRSPTIGRPARRAQRRSAGIATPGRCGPSGSSPRRARCCRAMRSSRTDVGWNKNGVGQQFDDPDAGHLPHPGRLRDDGVRRAGRGRARRWRSRIASSSRWSATEGSARTPPCCRPRARRRSPSSGS